MEWPWRVVELSDRFVSERVYFALDNGRWPESFGELAEWSGMSRRTLYRWQAAAREVFGEGVAGA